MKIFFASALFVMSGIAVATESPSSFVDAKKIWGASKNLKEYDDYLSEFLQFNNHFHLDTKDNCYALDKGPVELMLVIAHRSDQKYAVIERVLSDVENAKAQCFKKSYEGIQTKAPPFLPFVLQMSMDS